MGRRRTGGAEPLPQAVRRNNAKNERKTMEAMAETLWTSVESGKERRLRLAAERLYGISGAPGKAPTQQEAAEAPAKLDPKTDEVPTQQKAAEAPAKPGTRTDKDPTQQKAAEAPTTSETNVDKVATQPKAAEAPSTPEKKDDKAPIQQKTAEVLTTPDVGADKTSTQQKEAEASTIPDTEADTALIQQKAAEASTTPDTESDVVPNQQKVTEAPTTTEPVAEVKDVEEAALPEETPVEAAVPTEEAEVPEHNEEFSMSSWEMVDAPTQHGAAVEVETFEAGETLITTQKPVEGLEPTHQDVETLPSNEESVKDVAQTTNVKELEGTSVVIADTPASSTKSTESPSMAEQHADASASDKAPVDIFVGEVDKSSPMSEDVDKAPVAETAETGVTGKEADLPTASHSDVMTEPPTSTATLPNEEQTETATMEKQDLEVTDSKNDSKKKKKKKGKHTAEPSTPPATAPTGLENEPNADCEQGQQAKAGKKHKRRKDKRKESQSESEKGVTVEDESEGLVPTTSDVVSETSPFPPTSSEITKTDENNQDANVTESKTADPVDEEWTTVETKKTKRRRQRSERKSESEGKNQTDVHHEGEISPEVKTEPNLATEEPNHTEILTEQVTDDSTSKEKQADETTNSTGTTLDDFDRLMSSIGDLKEKFRQGSEATTEESMTSNKITNESIDDDEKMVESLSVKTQDKLDSSDLKAASGDDSSNGLASSNTNPETAAKDTTGEEFLEVQDPSQPEEKPTKDADAAPDAFDLLMSAGAGLEAGFNEAFSSEEQIQDEPKEVRLESQQTLGAESDSTKKEDVTHDAFDLLLSAGNDLQEGFKDSFGSEEQVPKEPEQQQQTTESTEAKPATVLQESVVAVSPAEPEDAPKTAEELAKEADAAPDVFDLLMSGGDDLEAGFKDAFGEEDQSEDISENNELKGQAQASTDSNTAVCLTITDADSSPLELEPKEASTTEENLAKEAESTLDAFDILLSAGDDLQEGFKESFSLEEEIPGETKAVDTNETKQTSNETEEDAVSAEETSAIELQATLEAEETEFDATPDACDELLSKHTDSQEAFEEELESTDKEAQKVKKDEDQSAALLHDTAGTELPQTVTAPVGDVNQTMEENTPKENTCSGNEVPVMPITTPGWFDKTLYDNAEAKYHEQLPLSQSRDNENKKESAVNETVTGASVIQEATPKSSEVEVAETVKSDLEISSKAIVVPRESIWYEKMMHDNAETRYYERLSQDKISEHFQEDTVLPSPPTAAYPSCLSETSKVDSLASAPKSGEAVEQPKSDNIAPESPPKSIVAPVESTWYDKAMHDEAEASHYERMSRSQRAEPSDKDKEVSSPATSENAPAPAVISSEQTWFDKPFHDSAETVRHVREDSNESDSSNKSFPLYEGCCDHFKPDDQQTPEEKVTHCGEVASHDSWTEHYPVTDTPDKPAEPAQDPTKTAPVEQTLLVTTSTPQKESDLADAWSGQLGDAAAQQTPINAQITVNIGERPHSPTSDDSRSRRSTFNSAVSPLSPQIELDDVYFEDVVLAGRQSDVTMAEMRGFTASPLSEGLAPGEQLDSLRTEPDLELSEPGTADTLDDGEEGVQPFSYDDIGDEGSATPVGDVATSAVIQSLVPEAKSAEQSEKELKDEVLSSTSDDLINEVNLEVNIPAAEFRHDVPSPSLDGGVTKFEMETSITAPTMPTDLPPVSLGVDIPEMTTTTEVGAIDLQAKNIAVPNIDIEIPSVQITAEVVPEPQTSSDTVKVEESTSPIMTSTPVKSDTQSSPIAQAIEVDPIVNVTSTSLEEPTSSQVSNQEPASNGTKEPSNISKELELPSKDIHEKLGLNEDGTVPLKESDEEVIKFTEQGAPRSPVATKRCSRKKKMRSGGRKSSSESVENQSSDNAKTSIRDEPSKPELKAPATDEPTKESIIPSSEATVAAYPSSVASATAEPKPSTEDNVAPADDTLAESVKEVISLAQQPGSQVSSDALQVLPVDNAVSAQANDAVSPVQTEPPTTDTKTADKSESPVIPEDSQPKLVDEETADKPEAPVSPVESQSEPAEEEIADKPEVLASTTQPETKPTDKETEAKVEAPASPTEPHPKPADTETPAQVKPEASTIPTETPSEPAEKPEVPVSYTEPPTEPAEKPEIPVCPTEPQEPQPKPADKPEVPVSSPEPQPKPADKPEVPVSSPEPQPKPADTRPAVTTKSVTSTLPNKAKPTDKKPASKVPATSLPILPDRTLFLPGDEGRTYASLMQQGADMLPARPVFTAHACHVCKRLHTKQHRLKSCGSCRLVAYCSAEHQRAHWPLHRALCKVITRRVRYLGTDHLYREALNVPSAEQWKKIRFKHMAVCEEMLGRPMEACEKEMFLYPRACDTCHETNPEKLHTCANCHSVSFCSEEHLRKNHSKYCKDLRLLLEIHSHQNAHGVCEPPLPETVLDTYEDLPPHIRELLVVSLLGPQRAMALGPVPLAVLSDYASYPLTLLYALQNIPTHPDAHISQLSELTVHVVGAEHATDCHPLSRWDAFLLHLLPRLRRLHVVFIGIELEAAGGRPGVTQRDFTCATCRSAGRRLTCELQPSTAYHTYCRSPQFRPPHVIAAFNAGLHRFAGHERRDTWRETIPYLVREGVPLILSGYTLLECPQDVARIQQEQRVDVLLPPMKNPYRSTRPQQNFLNEHEAPVVFKNQYVACLTAVATKARK